MKILLVEDDEILVAELAANLAAQNYTVEAVTDGPSGLGYAQAANYDIIVLDINLPGLDGISLCRELRRDSYEGAIMLLTAQGDSRCKVSGLDAGADDYVVKPCSTEELSARIRALLRRPREVAAPVLQWGSLQLDPTTRQVNFAGQQIPLSPKEYSLLELFLRTPQRVFSSATLLERLWGFDEMPGEETIRTHIKRLRRKLKRAGVSNVIENIYGMGYRLMPSPEAGTATAPASTSAAADSPSPLIATAPETSPRESIGPAPSSPLAATAARAAAVAALGQFKDVFLERLDVLAKAAVALKTETLSAELRQQAQQVAHKLVGSLGMFGLTEAASLSRQIDVELQKTATLDQQQVYGWIIQLRRELMTVLQVTNTATASEPLGQDACEFASTASHRLMVVSTAADWVTTLRTCAPAALKISALQEPVPVGQIAGQQPDVILVDMVAFPGKGGVSFVSELAAAYPNLPIFVRVAVANFQDRLQISRCCRCTFLPESLSAQETVQTVLRACDAGSPSLRVLAVDDDPIILQALKHQLSAQGIQVETLTDPRELWNMLPVLKPDLLMLDIEMPHVWGTELCQVIRSDRDWSRLPILFLSARQDAETVTQAYDVGADDYVAKPFTEPELTTRIMNRVKRYRTAHRVLPSSVG